MLRAATYCVATNGSESNDGSACDSAHAWLSPGGKASGVGQVLNPGDIIQFKGGTYPQTATSSLLPHYSGTSGAHITYRNFVGESPIITAQTTASSAAAFSASLSCDYIDVIGLKFTGGSGSGGAGIQIKNHHDITFDGVESYSNETGFYVWSDGSPTSHDITLKNSSVHDNSFINANIYNYTDHITLLNNTFATSGFHNIDVNSDFSFGAGAGQVTRLTLVAGGSGYSASFALSFSGGTCSGVTGTATASGGIITSVALTGNGSGCGTVSPTVSLAAGGGSGGSVEAEVCYPYDRTRTKEPQYITIKGNTIYGGAHEGVEVLTAFYVLIQNNNVHDNGYSGIQIEGGARYVIVDNNTTYNNSIGCPSGGEEGVWVDGTVYCVVSNNTSYNNEGGLEVSGSHYTIVRGNKVYLNKSCTGPAHYGSSFGISNSSSCTTNCHLGAFRGTSHVVIVQNSFYDSGGASNNFGPLMVNMSNIGYANYFLNTVFQNNIVSETPSSRDRCDPAATWAVNDYNVYYNSRTAWAARTGNTSCPSGTSRTFAAWQGLGWGYDTNTVVSDPLYTAPLTGNLALSSNSSPAYRHGNWLTTAVGSGSGSTSLTVANSDFFSDGFGLITGDLIQLQGNGTIYTVTAINRGTNVLTISPAASWANGAGVAYPYHGAQPDIGAIMKTSGGLLKITGR